MSLGRKIFPETLRTIAASTFTGSYQKLGGPLLFASVLAKFVNNTNQLVTISWDGTNAHDIIPAGSFALYDIMTNRSGPANALYIPAGTQLYVNSSAGTGSFYLVSLYIVES